MSCPISYQPRCKQQLPCGPGPCSKQLQPTVWFPVNKGYNSTYWNRIRYNQIKKQRSFPGPVACPTYQVAVSFGCVREISSPAQPLRLTFEKGGCPCPKQRIPVILSIANDGNGIVKMEWLDGSDVVLTLLPGEFTTLSLQEQAELSGLPIRVTYVAEEGGPELTALFAPVCFDETSEFIRFSLAVVGANGCLTVEA